MADTTQMYEVPLARKRAPRRLLGVFAKPQRPAQNIASSACIMGPNVSALAVKIPFLIALAACVSCASPHALSACPCRHAMMSIGSAH